MVDKKQAEDLEASIKQMLGGLDNLVKFAEKSTKGAFENMGKAESKKFAKAFEEMKFSDNINNLKKEMEDLKKTFNRMK